jgi:protein-S-isoprenylcysteine O-methyltransferase Ste14
MDLNFSSPDSKWIGAMWGIWGGYWLISAIRTKSTRQHPSSAERISYLVPMVMGLVLFTKRKVEWLNQPIIPQNDETLQFAIALVAAGLGFSIWARWHLGSNWSASVTVKEQHDLIRTGPYAWVRHPIYTGMLAGGIGTAIAYGELRAFVGLALITAGFIRKMQIEELRMKETFGEQYDKYKAQVCALIPYVY